LYFSFKPFIRLSEANFGNFHDTTQLTLQRGFSSFSRSINVDVLMGLKTFLPQVATVCNPKIELGNAANASPFYLQVAHKIACCIALF
jgi:hypothetical protein